MNEELITQYINDIDGLGFKENLTLNSKEVSKILSVTLRTLDYWRKENIGPNTKKVGKSYIYLKRDIAIFLAQN